jgi:xanthosine utilization system XapX-like protein
MALAGVVVGAVFVLSGLGVARFWEDAPRLLRAIVGIVGCLIGAEIWFVAFERLDR